MVFKFINSLLIGKEKSPKLYSSIEQIRAITFYQIMKTGDKSLLKIKSKKEVPQEILNETWDELLEQYSIASNSLNYKSILSERKQVEILKNKLTTLHACYLLLKLNATDNKQEIVNTLVYFGLPNDISVKELEQRINRENSYLKLLSSKNSIDENTANKKEEINFYRSVAKYEDVTGERIDTNQIILAHWIEKIKLLKSKKPTPNGRRK